MGRYIVDIRTGCAAVRDTHHIDYSKEGNGLHSDFGSVVEYVAYYNNHKGDGGDFEEQDERIKVKFLEDICSLLNFKHQTETPEEKEAFDSMANNSELPNGSGWDGKGLPPIGAIYTTEPHFDIELVCKYSSEYVVVGEMIDVPNGVSGIEVVVDLMRQKHRTFRKPETPQQREERERFERGEEMYIQHCKNMGADKFYWDEKNNASKEAWCKLAEQYRKAK